MGLASSQARLLSLTVRQHTIENRAQYLQAQKLRLSNESDLVYQKYINALDATKLETRTYDKDGKVHWIDGSFNNLTKYTSDDKANGNVYYVQDINDGLLYQPKKVCDAYNDAAGDIFKFFDNVGVHYIKDAHTPEYVNAQEQLQLDIDKGWNKPPYTEYFRDEFSNLNGKLKNPPQTDTYRVADSIYSIASGCKNTNTSGVYLSTNNTQLQELKYRLNDIKGTPYYTGDVKTIVDYCNDFNINKIFDNPENINSLVVSNYDNKTYISYNKTTEDAKTTEEKKVIDDQYKLSMLLNGGSYKIDNGNAEKIYTDSIQSLMNNYTQTENATMGDTLIKLAQNIMDAELEKSRTQVQQDLVNLLGTFNTDYATAEESLANYQTYKEHLAEFNAQSKETHTEYINQEEGLYYERMFYAIQSAGGCKEISDENAKSATWVGSMIKNAQVVLGVYNENDKDLDTITPSSNTGLREISNDNEITKADSEYEASLQDINSKETKYQTQLNQLEEERNAIQTEIESLKKIAKENIESTFKTFT